MQGCVDQDPFGLSKRHISGDYYLERWEDGETFYLHDSEVEYENFPDYGPIGGTVVMLAWNDNYILAQRRSHFGGKVDGWMVIDVTDKKITGPFSWSTISNNKTLTSLKAIEAKEAWSNL